MNGNIKYLPHPATSLRGKGWEDAIIKPEVKHQAPPVYSQSHQDADFSGQAEKELDPVNPYEGMT